MASLARPRADNNVAARTLRRAFLSDVLVRYAGVVRVLLRFFHRAAAGTTRVSAFFFRGRVVSVYEEVMLFRLRSGIDALLGDKSRWQGGG